MLKEPKSKSQPIPGQILPHSLEAEQSVIGALLRDNTAWDRVCDRISASDFYDHNHQLIFERITNLVNQSKPLDFVTLIAALKDIQAITSQEDEAYLYKLAHDIPGVVNIVAYADIVRERSVLRKLIQYANEIAATAYHPEGRTPKELLDLAERHIFSIAEHHACAEGPTSISQLLVSIPDRLEELQKSEQGALTGLSTGFTDLDRLTGGLQKGELIIIAGRPSMGKTAFAMNIVEHVASKGHSTALVFSLEMPNHTLITRLLSSLSKVEQKKIRDGRLSKPEWQRIMSTVQMLSHHHLFIDDASSLSPMELRARARRIARQQSNKKPLGLIVVDYLQLMHAPGYQKANRALEISEISRSLKTLAKELSVPVVALSQLNRGLEQRTEKRPLMSDLRESGSIEQDADIVAFIYRDEVYNPHTQDAGTAELIIAKHRNGPTEKIRLAFAGQYTRFRNYVSDSIVISEGNPTRRREESDMLC